MGKGEGGVLLEGVGKGEGGVGPDKQTRAEVFTSPQVVLSSTYYTLPCPELEVGQNIFCENFINVRFVLQRAKYFAIFCGKHFHLEICLHKYENVCFRAIYTVWTRLTAKMFLCVLILNKFTFLLSNFY